jgi:hypothetical protein
MPTSVPFAPAVQAEQTGIALSGEQPELRAAIYRRGVELLVQRQPERLLDADARPNGRAPGVNDNQYA